MARELNPDGVFPIGYAYPQVEGVPLFMEERLMGLNLADEGGGFPHTILQ